MQVASTVTSDHLQVNGGSVLLKGKAKVSRVHATSTPANQAPVSKAKQPVKQNTAKVPCLSKPLFFVFSEAHFGPHPLNREGPTKCLLVAV